jgi:MFS family permease
LASILTGFAQSPLQIGFGLALIGVFASIYHPVGIAMVIEGGGKIGWRLGMNGLWGNMGVAAAPLATGLILAHFNWRLAFIIPGSVSILIGLGFLAFMRSGGARPPEATRQEKEFVEFAPGWQRALVSLTLVTAAGGFVFGAMTFIIPRLFEVRMQGIINVIAPKTKPPAAVTKVRETKARCQPGANSTNSFSCRVASGGLAPPLRMKARKPRPISIETDPGMMKASRQLKWARIKPVANGAAATPILPHSPFIPRRQPIFPPPSITIAIPTGW